MSAHYNTTPPSEPPPTEFTPWKWLCPRCKRTYRIAVTTRCLTCNMTCLRTATPVVSRSPQRRRRHGHRRRPSSPAPSEFDGTFWALRNDWRRFRTAYESSPSAWKRRTMRELGGTSGIERRSRRAQLERIRRSDVTEDRWNRIIKKTQRCDQDCDYPSQCHVERYKVVRRLIKSSVEWDDEDAPLLMKKLFNDAYIPADEDVGDPPSLVAFDPDMEMTVPENINDNDEIIMAYEACEDADWFSRLRDFSDSSSSSSGSDDSNKTTESISSDETDEANETEQREE
ncbi:hypothetical protein ACJ41O_014147 [Fusarium nematophilum]